MTTSLGVNVFLSWFGARARKRKAVTNEAVESAYALKVRALSQALNDEIHRCLNEMGAGHPGQETVVLRQQGPRLAAEAVARAEAALPELTAAHLNAGDRDVDKVVARLGAFVDAIPAVPAGIYRSGHGLGGSPEGSVC